MADALVPEGDYHIVNAGNVAVAMDVFGAGTTNGSNVQVWTRNHSNAQVWTLRYRPDGTLRILSRHCGKCLDLQNFRVAQGANVAIHTDNDTRAQQWDLAATGLTATVDGTEYPTYWIDLHGFDGAWVVECDGVGAPPPGRNLCVAGREPLTSTDQHWAFVPVDPLVSGGVFEIVPMHAPNLRLDVYGNGSANGTNVQVYPHNSANSQKFYVTQESEDHWTIRHVGSGKLFDVQGASTANGANVMIHADNGGSNQRWRLVRYGDATVLGKRCPVVGIASWVEPTATKRWLDVEGLGTAAETNVFVHSPNEGANQDFALLPTMATDPTISVPSSLGAAPSVGAGGVATLPGPARAYPTWNCDRSWVTTGPNHYEYRSRRRYMRPSDSGWGAWSTWSAWSAVGYTPEGTRAWLTDGEDGTYGFSEAKDLEVEFQVRCVGVGETESLVGQAAGATFRVTREPALVVERAAMTGEGLRLGVSSDYACGRATMLVTSVVAGGVERLAADAWVDPDDPVVPMSSLASWPPDGSDAVVSWRVGSDLVPDFGVAHSQAVAVSYDSGEGAEPSLARGAGRTLSAAVPGDARMWVVCDGEARELVRREDGTFCVDYPQGRGFDLWTCVRDGDGWSTDVTHVAASDPLVTSRTAAHAWTLPDGRAVALEVRDGDPLSTERSSQASHETSELDARPLLTVDFRHARSVSFTAEGALVDGHTEADVADFEALPGTHALYRSPHGHVARVAVTSVATSHRRGHQVVTVEMMEEAT